MATGEGGSAALIAYLVQAIHRASTVYASSPRGDPRHGLALGEAVALFNLADEFGLIETVRRGVDERVGRDAYRGLSEAMKVYYLGSGGTERGVQRPAGPSGGRSPRRRSGPSRRDG